MTAAATATIEYRGHVLHGARVIVRQWRDDLSVNGRKLGPLVHVDVVRGRVTGGFWLPPEAVRGVADVSPAVVCVDPPPLALPRKGGGGVKARPKVAA